MDREVRTRSPGAMAARAAAARPSGSPQRYAIAPQTGPRRRLHDPAAGGQLGGSVGPRKCRPGTEECLMVEGLVEQSSDGERRMVLFGQTDRRFVAIRGAFHLAHDEAG